ncbi:MAG: hypothetical protein U1F56_07015 [Rubrivivax sp.]
MGPPTGADEPRRAAQALEALLARLYTDAALRDAFLAAPEDVARRAGLSDEQSRRLAAIDREGLVLAAASLAARRAPHPPPPAPSPWARLWRRWRQGAGHR